MMDRDDKLLLFAVGPLVVILAYLILVLVCAVVLLIAGHDIPDRTPFCGGAVLLLVIGVVTAFKIFIRK